MKTIRKPTYTRRITFLALQEEVDHLKKIALRQRMTMAQVLRERLFADIKARRP